MAKFRIIGADRETGDDLEITLDASSVRSATDKARNLGMLVSECALVDAPPEPEPRLPPALPAQTVPVQPPPRTPVAIPPTPKSWWHLILVEQARTSNSVALLVTIIAIVGFFGLCFAGFGVSMLVQLKKGPEAFSAILLFLLALACFLNVAVATGRLLALLQITIANPLTAWFRTLPPGVRIAIFIAPLVFVGLSILSAIGSYEPLPRITVSGGGAPMMSLTNWKIDHTKLTANAYYSGYGIVRFIYEVRENGILKKTDTIGTPGNWQKGDTVEISIFLPERPSASTEVNVIVDGL